MIHKVAIRRFKRFQEVEFSLPGHVVIAGPNNTGKTTLLQAIAAFDLALARWQELNDFQRHGGGYTKAPIARQAFAAVPLRSFDLLWSDRRQQESIEIEIHFDLGLRIGMEFIPDTTEQMYVRPLRQCPPIDVRATPLGCVFVPAMSGLSIEEPVYQRPKIEQLLFQARPGEVLRNLLVQASMQSPAWDALVAAMRTAVRSAQERADALGVYRGNLSALDLLTEISARVPADLEVVFEELAIDRQVVRVRGFTKSFEAVDRLRAELAKFAPFGQIQVSEVKEETRRGGKSFSLTISLGRPGEEAA